MIMLVHLSTYWHFVGPCHHGMTHSQVADGGNGHQMWRVAVNVLNKQLRTVDRSGPPD